MKTISAPNGENITVPESRVISLGMSDTHNDLIRKNLPTAEYELYETDTITDIIAINADTVIINSSALNDGDRDKVIEYYTEVGLCLNQTVLWIGTPKPPSHLRCVFGCFECIEMLAVDLKYRLMQAHRKEKKASDFSRKLADCIVILSLIRSNPGIKTKELSNKMELSARTVQRYISTLQAAGEWIEYDTMKRGWKLQYGISILFNDHLKGIPDYGTENEE